MVKRFSKQVRDELHVACTNWLSPPAPGCGVSLMESARKHPLPSFCHIGMCAVSLPSLVWV